MFYLIKIIEKLVRINYIKFKLIKILSILLTIVDQKHKKIVEKQLKYTGLKESYLNINEGLFTTILNYLQLSNYKEKDLKEKVKIKKEKELINLIKENNYIFVSSHYSNWEIMLQRLSITVKKLDCSAKPQKEKELYEYIQEKRQRFGAKIFDKENALKNLLNSLKEKRNILFLADQNVDIKSAVICDFFKKETPFLKTAGLLSFKRNTEIIYIGIKYIYESDSYEIDWKEPFKSKKENKEENIKENVCYYVENLEQQILKNPKEWLWAHRRWKSINPELYKNF